MALTALTRGPHFWTGGYFCYSSESKGIQEKGGFQANQVRGLPACRFPLISLRMETLWFKTLFVTSNPQKVVKRMSSLNLRERGRDGWEKRVPCFGDVLSVVDGQAHHVADVDPAYGCSVLLIFIVTKKSTFQCTPTADQV